MPGNRWAEHWARCDALLGWNIHVGALWPCAPENNECSDYVYFKRDWLMPFGASYSLVMSWSYVFVPVFVHVVEPNPCHYTDFWGQHYQLLPTDVTSDYCLICHLTDLSRTMHDWGFTLFSMWVYFSLSDSNGAPSHLGCHTHTHQLE